MRALTEGSAAVAALVGSLPNIVVPLLISNQMRPVAGQHRWKGLSSLVGLEMLKKMHILDKSSAALDTLIVALLTVDPLRDTWVLGE